MEAELDSAPVPSARPKAQKGAGKEPKKSQAGDKGGKGKGKGGKGKGKGKEKQQGSMERFLGERSAQGPSPY